MQLKTYDYYTELERPVAAIFNSMSNRGVKIDLEYLKQLKVELESQFKPIEEEIKQKLGIENVNSDKQVIEALDKRFGLQFELKGKRTRSKVALEKAAHIPIVSLLLKHSELGTLLDTFVYQYLARNTDCVRPFFSQCGTRTGRPSCSNPNLLQIPKRTENGRIVRNMFKARSGMELGEADYSAIEPRVLAHLSQDENLCQLFNDSTDFHTWTSERLGISRDRAKVLNLSVGYRATFKSVMAQLGGTKDEAQKQIDSWWALFPSLRRWQEGLIYDSKRSGYCTTLLGRRIRVDRLDSPLSWERESAERQLVNNITQGSAAEIMKMAMIKIHNSTSFSPLFGLLIQIYDSLVFESPEIRDDGSLVVEYMKKALDLSIPLNVELKTGNPWGEIK